MKSTINLNKEVRSIRNPYLRRATEMALKDFMPRLRKLPSSLRHHPKDERGPGGLILHIRRMVWGCHGIMKQFDLSETECDCLITAAVFHDIGVVNAEKHDEKVIHADVSAGIFACYISKIIDPYLLAREIRCVQNIIRTHGGRWYPFHERPAKKLQLLFSLLDYIVSRTNVLVDPDGET